MPVKDKLEKWISENPLTIVTVILVIAVVFAIAVILAYWYEFKSHPVVADPAPWGQFGDFFGGTLNPVFGFLSVMALLAALVIQGKELKDSSQELKNSTKALNAQHKAIVQQSFEQTFFSWLETYQDMLDSVVEPENSLTFSGELRGRTALSRWLAGEISIQSVLQGFSERTTPEMFLSYQQENPDKLTRGAMDSWEALYKRHEYQLDSLFRNLYRLILWIDSQNEDRINAAQKWLYVGIVRAQLSWIEMAYLFYNGYTLRGEKFKPLVEKYALFDNMNFDSDSVIVHVRRNPPKDICYADSAYDSRLARKGLGLPESTEDTLALAAV